MLFLGDTYIKKPFKPEPLFKEKLENQITLINAEFSIETQFNHSKLGPKLFLKEEEIEYLIGLFDVYNLANNHSSDGGDEGLEKLRELIESRNGLVSGLKHDPIVVEENNCVVGIYSLTDYFYGNSDNLSHINDLDKVVKDDNWDYCVVQIHMGIEQSASILPVMKDIALELSSRGIDIIFFHHAHLPSGFEKVGNCHVYYGLGDFIFDYASPRPGIAVEICFSKDRPPEDFIYELKIDFSRKVSITNKEPKSPKIINFTEEKFYFNRHLSYHFSLCFNLGILNLSFRDFVRYIVYSTIFFRRKLIFREKLNFQFKFNNTYKYFYDWYFTHHRRNRKFWWCNDRSTY